MATKKTRHRRSDEEMIADLQAKLEQVKQRAQARELKQSPELKHLVNALKSIDKGLEVAAESGDGTMRHTLADARKPLAGYLEKQGIPIPKARLPRGRRPRDM